MEQGTHMMMAEMSDMSDCMQAEQAQLEKSCCQDDQCSKHCQTMQCHNFGKLPALSINGGFEPSFLSMSQTHARIFHEPGNGISNTPLRPPIVQL